MRRMIVIVGCNMGWCMIVSAAFGLTFRDPLMWGLSLAGALLFICIVDGWFPEKLPREDKDD